MSPQQPTSASRVDDSVVVGWASGREGGVEPVVERNGAKSWSKMGTVNLLRCTGGRSEHAFRGEGNSRNA